MDRPTTRPALWMFIAGYLGIELPFTAFSPGFSTPFDFVADAFFNPQKDIAAWANRSGIKTLGASILAALEYRFADNLQSRVLSGSEDQAKNMYSYWAKFCDSFLADRLDDKSVKQMLTKIGGGKMEILSASQRRVRGPKVHRLYEDELDEIDTELDEAAAGMIASSDEHPGRTIYTSTWHKVNGAMQRLIEASPGNGVTVHRWALWESIQNCDEDRHGYGTGCKTCGLAPTCLDKARQIDPRAKIGIASKARGLYRLDDAIKAYRKLGKASWGAEYLCLRPSVKGAVYPAFDGTVHCTTKPPAALKIYRAIDWGLNVFVCLWVGEDKNGTAYVLDTYRSEIGTIPQHIKHIKEHKYQNIAATYVDPAGRNRNDQTGKSNIDVFREAGIECRFTMTKRLRNVQNGIRLVADRLEPNQGPPRLMVVQSANNAAFIKAMQSYCNRKVNGIFIPEPQDPQEFEHIPDALRYFIVNRETTNVVVKAYGAN